MEYRGYRNKAEYGREVVYQAIAESEKPIRDEDIYRRCGISGMVLSHSLLGLLKARRIRPVYIKNPVTGRNFARWVTWNTDDPVPFPTAVPIDR